MAKVVTLADRDIAYVQLATRFPKRLHRALKVHCVSTEQAVVRFVTQALAERLAREATR